MRRCSNFFPSLLMYAAELAGNTETELEKLVPSTNRLTGSMPMILACGFELAPSSCVTAMHEQTDYKLHSRQSAV